MVIIGERRDIENVTAEVKDGKHYRKVQGKRHPQENERRKSRTASGTNTNP